MHWLCTVVYLMSTLILRLGLLQAEHKLSLEKTGDWPYLTFPFNRSLVVLSLSLWDSASLIYPVSKIPSCTPKWVILAPRFLSYACFCWVFFPFIEFISAKWSTAHESISHAQYYRWISFSLYLRFSLPPPATSVSNLKNTMSPHSSILNTYPSNLQADPITRIRHGTPSLLLLDWSRGDCGGLVNMEDQVLDCSRG